MSDLPWAQLLVGFEWLVRLVMLPIIVLRKEQPTAALAWLMVIFFEPIIGLVIYLLIGESRLVRRRMKRRRRRHEEYAAGVAPAVDPNYVVDPERQSEYSILVHLAEEVGGRPVVSGNRIEYLNEYDCAVDRLVADIEAAEHHVHLLYYIFADDAVGRRVGEALIRAVQRGVACRVLADHVGSRRMFRRLAPLLRRHGVEVVPVMPVSFFHVVFKRLDLRNHRKLAVIDGRIVFTGSQNICEATFGTHERLGAWHEIMARITGPVVRQFQEVFVEDWYHETQQRLESPALMPECPPAGSTPVQLVPTGPDLPTADFQDLVVKTLFLARRRIVITSPYFVPGEAMTLALRLAARRGVRVDVVVPRRTEHPIVDAAGRFYLELLCRAGVHVHVFEKGMLHSKAMTVDDDVAMFGSANYDIRSFMLNFELNLLLHAPAAVGDLVRLQDIYVAQSRELTQEDWSRRTLMQRLLDNLAKLLSPLL